MDQQTLLERLLEAGVQLAEQRTLDPLLTAALDAALEIFSAELGYLSLLDENGDLDFRARRDCLGHDLDLPDEGLNQAIRQTVIQAGEELLIARSPEAYAAVGLPLTARQRRLGALYLENRTFTAAFDPQALAALRQFAALTGLVIDNARLNQAAEADLAQRSADLAHEIEAHRRLRAELERQAITDSLTGVFNRRHFFELADYEMGRAERYRRPLALILLDVDHFKVVNDVFGHVVGDSVLAGVAKQLCAELRQSDILARYGGEEFVVLLPETELGRASDAAERLRKAIVRQEFKMNQGGVSTTISLGVVCMSPDQPISLDRLLERAEKALATAKNTGRNRVVCA